MGQGFDPRTGRESNVAALKEAIRAQIVEIHTAHPGEVVAFNSAVQVVRVQLCLEREVVDDTEAITELVDVPVMTFRGGGFSLTLPLNVGDTGLVIFLERGADNWVLDGGCQPQFSRRHHHLSDAIFIPGLYAQPDVLTAYNTDDFVIRTDDGQGQFCMSPNGEFALTNGTEELLTIIDDLAQAVSDMQTIVTGGSSAGNYTHTQVAAVNDIRTRLAGLMK